MFYLNYIFKVNYVGGLAKVAIREKVATGGTFTNSNEMVNYLVDKFKDRSDMTFYFKAIDCSVLDEERASVKFKDFETVNGSSSFHAVVCKTGASALRQATQICICESYKGEYGSYNEFMEYPIPNFT